MSHIHQIARICDLFSHPLRLEVIEETGEWISREAYWIYTYLAQGVPLLNSLTAIKRSVRQS